MKTLTWKRFHCSNLCKRLHFIFWTIQFCESAYIRLDQKEKGSVEPFKKGVALCL